MAKSLLAHLYTRIKGSQEDVATLALQYVLSQSSKLNETFNLLISKKVELSIDKELKYRCQAVGDNLERPDMSGINSAGQEVVLCEMKFYASLTEKQPNEYIDRLIKANGKVLVIVCPEIRRTSLWKQIIELTELRNVIEVNNWCIDVDGIRLCIFTWAEILEHLRRVASESALDLISDINQLVGYCDQMDSEAFVPFKDEDLSAKVAKLADRYYSIVDETIELLHLDQTLKTSRKGLKATAYRSGYQRGLYVDCFAINMVYDRDMWKNPETLETPFWLSIRNENWDETEAFLKQYDTYPTVCCDKNSWNICFLALEAPLHSTKDEVCYVLKKQILKFLDDFRDIE